MGKGVKISLPGYDAETDTDLDHFALWVDSDDSEDSVLIKEYTRGSASVPVDYSDPYEITHNLGYIPFFLVYVYDESIYYGGIANKWKLCPNIASPITASPFYVFADTTKIYIYNVDGDEGTHSNDFKWYIFYDNQVGSSAKSITESDVVFKVSKDGVDATDSVDPNDYIFHSDLNTFKIIKEGIANITYTSNQYYTFAHGASLSDPASFLCFAKFPDGKTQLCAGRGQTYSIDYAFLLRDMYIDTSNIGFYLQRFSGSETALTIKYYIFETPL